MATPTQISYIQDLAVKKTKEFKEVKELLVSNGIVSENAEIVSTAVALSDICNALTDIQASKLIDVLIAAKTPSRGNAYALGRVRKAVEALDEIKATIDDWGFDELR